MRHRNASALPRVPRAKDRAIAKRGDSSSPTLLWQWTWRGGEKGGSFSLPATLRTKQDMRKHRNAVIRKIADAADMMATPALFSRIEILPHRSVLGQSPDKDEITGWYVTDDGEAMGYFDLVRPQRQNPSKRGWQWFDPLPMPPQPRLTRDDYRRLHEHAVEWIGAHDNPGDPMRLSVGVVYAVPDLVGGTQVDFRYDPKRKGLYYSLSAATLKRRAAAK